MSAWGCGPCCPACLARQELSRRQSTQLLISVPAQWEKCGLGAYIALNNPQIKMRAYAAPEAFSEARLQCILVRWRLQPCCSSCAVAACLPPACPLQGCTAELRCLQVWQLLLSGLVIRPCQSLQRSPADNSPPTV